MLIIYAERRQAAFAGRFSFRIRGQGMGRTRPGGAIGFPAGSKGMLHMHMPCGNKVDARISPAGASNAPVPAAGMRIRSLEAARESLRCAIPGDGLPGSACQPA